MALVGRHHRTVDSILASGPPPGFEYLLRSFFRKIADVAELFDSSAVLTMRVASVKSLIVDPTHLVLASGKLVLQEAKKTVSDRIGDFCDASLILSSANSRGWVLKSLP